MTIRSISYGGGVQSSAMIVLAVQGKIDAEVALFCNVGDDSEHPKTLAYVRDVMTPWATDHGFPVHELQKVGTRGAYRGPITLRGKLMRPESRSLPIPVRMSNGARARRSCTGDFKIALVRKWLREHGATADDPAVVNIGISTDEIERAGRRDAPYERGAYPLLDLGLSRGDCAALIGRVGLPVPPKSACYFCPFHKPSTWAQMRRDEPELFADAQLIEDTLNERRDKLGKDHVWLTRFNKRLSDAVAMAQDELDFEGIGETGCDEGVCFV